MVVDTSALVAILRREPEWPEFLAAMTGAVSVRMSAGNWVELGIEVLGRLPPAAEQEVESLCAQLRMQVVPLDQVQAELARSAFRRFGRGRHPAGLNLGDCFAYALARQLNEPLLFKGDDFARTDVSAAFSA